MLTAMPKYHTGYFNNLSDNGFSIKTVIPTDKNKVEILNDIAQLRYQVWQHHDMDMSNSLKECAWLEEIDHHAYLWAIYKDKILIASARLTYHPTIQSLPDFSYYQNYSNYFPEPITAFNRLIVLDKYRNMKLSSYLNQMRIQQAVDLKAKSIALICPELRIQSLLKQGFKQLTPPMPSRRCSSINWVLMSKVLS